MDAVIATNTTLGREGVEGLPHGDEAGGLSGAPVREKSTHTVKVLAGELGGRLPIIAAGGITEGAHAAEKIAAGASLVQIYSGFIYKGPALIREAVDAIAALPRRMKGLLAEPARLRPPPGWGVPWGNRLLSVLSLTRAGVDWRRCKPAVPVRPSQLSPRPSRQPLSQDCRVVGWVNGQRSRDLPVMPF